MEENKNVTGVRKLFECFGKGDIPGAMNLFAEKVEFQSPVSVADHKHISWSKTRNNKSEIGTFFQELNEKVQAEKMEILEITAQDDRVVVEGKNAGTVRASGTKYEHNWVMIFNLKNGKIIRNMHYYDSADLEEAF